LGDPASVNAAVRRLFAKFHSPRFPRNVSPRRGKMGRAIMKLRAHFSAPRGMRYHCAAVINGVARAGFGRAFSAGADLRPNPAFERTRRGSPAFLCDSLWRHAAQLVR
jgi:hypothetical protein